MFSSGGVKFRQPGWDDVGNIDVPTNILLRLKAEIQLIGDSFSLKGLLLRLLLDSLGQGLVRLNLSPSAMPHQLLIEVNRNSDSIL